MVPLTIWQFNAGPDTWVNTIAGGEGTQIMGAMGKVRAAGIFSYNLGLTFFYGASFAIALANEALRDFLPKILTRLLLAAAILTGILSASRTSVLSLALIIVGFCSLILINTRLSARGLSGFAIVIVCLLMPLSFTGLFREGQEVLITRFTDAAEAEAVPNGIASLSFLNRLQDSLVEPFDVLPETPLLGRGLGLGTNAGSQLSTGAPDFLLAENEWPRVVMEAGPIVGFGYMLLRVVFTVWLVVLSLRAAMSGNALPFLLWCACAYNFVFGQWGPPATLGLAMFVAGLCLTSMSFTPIEPRLS